MSETIETKKFLGMEGVNALLEGLKGEYSPLEHVHSWEELEEKPFYEERTETPVFENVTGSWNIGERPAVNIDPSVIINTGTTYKIICTSDFYGTSVTEIHEIVAENNVLNFTIDGFPAYIDGGKIRVEDNSVSGSLDVSLYEVQSNIACLDEKFIPDTISRTDHTHEAVTNAEHSSTADTATEATHATEADHALSADTAIKAEQDGNGNVIADTYALVGHIHSYNELTDKTHWIDHARTLLDNETFECTSISSDSTSYYCAKSGNIGLVDGKKYNVTVNGTSYVAPALYAFGSEDISLIAEIDLCRIYDRANGTVEVFSNNSTTLTITISDVEDVYHELDERFIPDTIARATDIDSKMNKENPEGTGSLSMNRSSNSEIGENSVAMGTDCVASGASSIALGSGTSATGFAAFAEGAGTVSSGDVSHSEGQDSKATGYASHAECAGEANGDYSHASGYGIADGNYSHASGNGTWAVGRSQTVIGEANIEDTATDAQTRGTYAVIVGNGDMDAGEFSNASTLDWEGNAWYQGDVYVGSTSGVNKDEGSKKLATEEYVDTSVANLVNSAPETLDTLGELATAFNENQEVVEALDTAIINKADKEHTHSFNDLDDKPFYEDVEKTLIEYNDSTPINISSKIGTVYFISSLAPTMEELIGATVIYNKNGLITQTLTADDITTSSTYPGSYCVNGINYGGSNNGFFVVYDYTQSSKFTQNGIYVVNTIQSIELTTSVLKTLDEKFIPDTIAKIENLNGLTTEEYVNTSIYNSTLVKSGTGDYSIMFYHIGSDGNVVASPAEASGDYSRAFGIGIASGEYSLIEGYNTYATASDVDKMINTNESAYSKGYCTHAEGYHTVAYGAISHSEGCSTKTIGAFSHAEGIGNIAQGDAQHVQGKYNIQDTDNKYAHIVGNGPSTYLRSNAHTLDWEGNAWYQGSVEATAIILKSPNGTRFNITIDDDGVLKADEITE